MLALRKIRTFDDEILRRKCRHVEKVDDRIRGILEDMAETMYNTPNAGGLAACQVGILKRLVVIDLGEGLIKLVNPQILKRDGEQLVTEGCLSFPGVWGITNRPKSVVVTALNEYGERIVLSVRGEMAKCLSHEIDHLDGTVFTDKVIEYIDV